MNGKKAKQLRAAALDASVGMPKVLYERVKGVVRLEKNCTRYLYKLLKKKYKAYERKR